MTNTPEQPSRLDRIERILEQAANQQQTNTTAIAELRSELAQRQATTQEQLDNLAERQANTQNQLTILTDNVDRVLARSAILDDVLLELRDSHLEHQRNFERHQRNFEEHQRTTNAALQSLEAILLQLMRNFPQN